MITSRYTLNAIAFAILGTTLTAFAADKTALSDATPYGFIQFNGTYENSAANGGAAYSNLARQPADTEHSGGLYATARASRIGIKGALANNSGNFLVEADFGGSPNGTVAGKTNAATPFQLRHAYLQSGKWLVGQTWTNAFDLNSAPESIDSGTPITSSGVRQAQIRYTLVSDPMNTVSVSAETPSSFVTWTTDKTTGKITSAINNGHATRPDFTFNFTHKQNWGSLALVGVKNQYIYDLNGGNSTADGYLVGLSGSYKLSNGKFVGGITRGDGAGRYQWGSWSQAVSFNGTKLSTYKSKSQWVSYQHKFSDTLRANASYAVLTFDDAAINTLDTAALNNKQLRQYVLNAFTKVASNVEVGAEWVGGKRLKLDNSLSHENRVNLQVRATF